MQVPVITLGNAAFLQYVHNFLRGSPRVDRRVMQERDPLFRRLPKRGFNSPDHIEYTLVNLNILEDNFAAGDVVDAESLRAKNLLGKTERMIKILANGEITKALTVKADKFSAAAKAKIEAVGGKVEVTE